MSLVDRMTGFLGRLGGGQKPSLDVYVFGKHPAWPDFIDVARLPPVPASFHHFHDKLRSGVDAVYTEPAPVPRFLLWTLRGRSGALGVFPSRDGGNPRTGKFRRSPLLIGASARVPLSILLHFAGPRIVDLAGVLSNETMSDGEVIIAINRHAGNWRSDFAGVEVPPAPPDRTPPKENLPVMQAHGDLSARAQDAVSHFVTDRSPTVLTVAAAPAGLFVARFDWDRLDAETLRGSLEETPVAE